MQVMSTKEEWLYRLVIKNVRLKPREGGYIVDILLSGVPKDKYDTKMVLKVIGHVQDTASKILETLNLDDNYSNLTTQVQKQIEKEIFGN